MTGKERLLAVVIGEVELNPGNNVFSRIGGR